MSYDVSMRIFDFVSSDQQLMEELLDGADDESDDDGDDDECGPDDYHFKKKRRWSPRVFTVEMFGINEVGTTFCVTVQDFQPFFYVRVSPTNTNADDTFLGSTTQLRELQNAMFARLRERHNADAAVRGRSAYTLKDETTSSERVEFSKLYGYSPSEIKKDQFVKFTFSTYGFFRKWRSLWFNEDSKKFDASIDINALRLELYESQLHPLLRMFHIHNISPSGWIKIDRRRFRNVRRSQLCTTTCAHAYSVRVADIVAQSDKETCVPFKICSFDIEASSSHGDFPVAVKTYKRLAAYLVDRLAKEEQGEQEADRIREKLSKWILASFFGADDDDHGGAGGGVGSHRDPNRVYPKLLPAREQLMSMIDRVFTCDDSCISASDRAEKNERGRLESFFEKISQRNTNIKGKNQNATTTSLGLCCEDGEEGGGSGGESDDELLMITLPRTTNKSVSSCAIVDMFLDRETKGDAATTVMTRDMKVSCLNDKLMMELPPLRGDEVTFVGSSFMKNGSLEPYYQNCIVQNAHGVTCDAVDGIDILNVDSETRLLLAWTDLIQRENPDIIIGYNIFQFDYDFMFQRAKENGCEKYFLKLSRKRDEICATKKYGCDDYELEKTQIILATGEYNLNYVKMAGRLQIDMYTFFRRDYNLPSYKLDDVAGQYIADDIVDVVEERMVMGLLTRNVAGLKLGDYIHLEICGFTNDYLDQGRKFAVLTMTPGGDGVGGGGCTVLWLTSEDTDRCGELIRSIFAQKKKKMKWCIAKDDVSPQEIFRLTNGDGRDLAKVAKYCLQDCNLVHHLLSKIDVLTGYQEMSRLCSVPVSFLVLRGQGIKLTSYVAKKCREKNTLMPDLVKQDVWDSGGGSGYEGAIVLPPKCNMYIDEPVAVLDFASLYPSCMISHNFSHDSKMSTSEYDMHGKLVVYSSSSTANATSFIDVEFDVFEQLKNPAKPKSSKLEKTKVGTKVCRWAQLDNNARSIMPSILEELLAARKEARTKIKLGGKDMDPFMQNILDKRQLAYKLTANSLYGQCGSRTSTFYDKDLAASTTATGRKMILYAKRVIEEVYGRGELQPVSCYAAGGGQVVCNAEYIYGDTDSVFFTFGLQDPLTRAPIRGRAALEITIELAQRAARKCTDGLVAPMELSYEKTMMPFILLSKKRYVGMLYETDPTRGKMKAMGLSLKRRDSCDYLKDTYGEILNILMKDQKLDKALTFLKSSLTDLIEGKVSMDKLTITKSLRGYYKNPAQIAHAVLAERVGNRDPGNKPKPGDRIPFVHIVVSATEVAKKKLLQGDKIEIPEYVAQNKLKIDYAFYITNQLMNPLLQLFVLSVEQIVQSRHTKEYTKAVAMKGYLREIRRLENEFPDEEVFAKKKEKFQVGVVKRELFDDFLLKIEQDKQNIRAITHFF